MSLPEMRQDDDGFAGSLVCAGISDNGFNIQCSNVKSIQRNGRCCVRRLMDEIDEQADSLRFYRLGANWRSRVEHVGNKAAYDPDGPLVF